MKPHRLFLLILMMALLSGFSPSGYARTAHGDNIAVSTGSDAEVLKLDGNTEKIRWEQDDTLVWEAPVGDRVLMAFPLPDGVAFDQYGLGKFDVKIEGGPVDIMAFIEEPGEKRRIYRPIDITVPRTGWQTIYLDLSQPEIIRESYFQADRPRITFNFWSVKTGYPDEQPTRRISLRNLRLVRRYLDVEWNGIDYRSRVEPSGDLVYDYTITVKNRDHERHQVLAGVARYDGTAASSLVTPEHARIAPGDSASFTVTLRLSAPQVQTLPELYCEWFLPVFSVEGIPDSEEGILRSSDRIALPILIMPEKLENPVILFDRRELQEIRERYHTTDWGKREGERYILDAETFLAGDLAIPDGPGWAAAYYFCHEHRCPLEYQGPGRHWCPVGGEHRDVDFMGVDLDRDYRTNQHTTTMRAARSLALAFALTGDRRYSEGALSILKQYRANYFTWDWLDLDGSTETIDKGRIQFAKYMEAIYMLDLTEAFDILRGTGGMSEEDARDIQENLLIPASVEMTDYRMGMIHRQTCITKNALATGLACRHAPLIAFATAGQQSVLKLRRCAATADGISHGHGYADLSRRQLDMAGMFNRVGLNTYDHMLKRILWGSFWWSVPFNPRSHAAEWLSASRHYPDPIFRTYASRNLLEGEAEPLRGTTVEVDIPPSANFPNSGLSILRRPWGNGTLDAEFKWGIPDNRGSFSVLSLGLYFGGYRCQSYPGHFPWGSTDLHHRWQIQSASHATLVVDRQNQSGMKDYFKDHYMPHPSEQLLFEESATAVSTVAYNDRIYPGVKIWRSVSVLEGAVLVLDVLRSSEEHTYDRWFHGVPDHSNGLAGIHLAMKPRATSLGTTDGYEMVRNLSNTRTDGDFSCDWIIPPAGNRKKMILTMNVLNTQPLEVIHGFEWSYQYRTPEKEFLLLSRRAKIADFIVLYEPNSGKSAVSRFEKFDVVAESGEIVEGALGVAVTLGERTYEIVFNPDMKMVRTTKGTTTRIVSIESTENTQDEGDTRATSPAVKP